MNKIPENQTELGKRLLACGPEFDVFAVHARELEEKKKGKEIGSSLLTELLKEWPNAPVIFSDEASPPQPLSWLDRTKQGYSGPRSTYPFTDALTITPVKEAGDLLADLKKSGVTKVVIVFPDRMGESTATIKEYKKLMPDLARDAGIEIALLPLYKMDGSSSRTEAWDSVSFGVSFWSPVKPAEDDYYLILDNIIAGGRTVEAIRSFLKEQGIEDEKIKGLIIGTDLTYEDISVDKVREGIRDLRKDNPVTAARCDIMLDMLGICGLNALTPPEYSLLYRKHDPKVLFERIAEELKYCMYVPQEVGPEFLARAASHGIIPGGKLER